MHPSALIRSGAQAPRSVACAPPRMNARNAAPRSLSGAKPSAAAHSTTPSSVPVASVISDAAVPEGHRGLHASLYGEGGAEAHDSSTDYRVRKVGCWCSCCTEFYLQYPGSTQQLGSLSEAATVVAAT